MSTAATIMKNLADWYPLKPAQAIESKEPLPINNTNNVASYVLLCRISYYPDDPDNKVCSAPYNVVSN